MDANACILAVAESPENAQTVPKESEFRSRETTMRYGILTAFAAGTLLSSRYSVQAADFAGSVQGVVKSASGQALSGAYVKLINPERRLTFMVISQTDGRYTLNNLPPGDYTVQGIGNGFQSKLTPV